jgi:aromatic-L-amino-acid decarboxylase
MIDLSPEQFRTLGYRAIDSLAEQFAALPNAPARRVLPEGLRESLMHQPLPDAGQPAEEVLAAIASSALNGELSIEY